MIYLTMNTPHVVAFPKMGKVPRNEADEGAPFALIKWREAL